MTRRAFFATAFGVSATAHRVTAQAEVYTLAMGQLSSADHELADGYAGIGQTAAIIVKPGTPAHDRLKELCGQKPLVSLLVRVDGL